MSTMTERRHEDIETPERTHDQPAEGGREQADQADEQSMNEGQGDRPDTDHVE